MKPIIARNFMELLEKEISEADCIRIAKYADILYSLSSALRLYRHKYQITQKKLSAILGISVSTISRIESGDCDIRLKDMIDIACKLNMEVEVLIYKRE